MAGFVCDVVTREAKLASIEAELVVVPGIEGEMGFLQGHASLVSVLADGEVRVRAAEGGEARRYALQGGYVEVSNEKVIVLADRAVLAEDIDVAQVQERLSDVEAKIGELSEQDLRKTGLVSDRAWYTVQLRVARAA